MILNQRIVEAWIRLLIVIAVVIIAWLLVDETGTEKVVILLSAGLITSYIIAVLASLPPITEISLGANEVLRVFSPAAFPFCIQQYRDYSAELFSYTVCFGWPEGIPLLQLPLWDSHESIFVHEQHFRSGLSLGLLLLLGMTVLVGILTIIDTRCTIPRKKLRVSSLLLVSLQFSLIILVIYLYLTGNIIYPFGGLIVLLITLYPTLRAVRNRSSEKKIQQLLE
ncbi:MAG: hypothetical protein C4K48_00795 [Candidatus Thorarchaeota archaeon]|nr:MAG: hypothetical protein C4K48_00795 [Candidatus Thorarchaeota archaeon]